MEAIQRTVQITEEGRAEANRALVSAGLTPAERAEWDYKTAVGLKMLLDITKSLEKTSK